MKAARESWFEQVADLQVNQLVFLDEFGASTTMQRTHGRAAPGERLGHVESVAISRTRHGKQEGAPDVAERLCAPNLLHRTMLLLYHAERAGCQRRQLQRECAVNDPARWPIEQGLERCARQLGKH